MQIKFRGFRKDGKGWVEGYYRKQLFYNRFDNTLLYEKHFIGAFDNLTYFDGLFEQVEIHPESLSMLTGLTDKNGKEIFGKDLLQSDNGDKFLVDFRNGSWVIVHEPTCGAEIDGECKTDLLFDAIKVYKFEIIGNQYEQPQNG